MKMKVDQLLVDQLHHHVGDLEFCDTIFARARSMNSLGNTSRGRIP